ncbi:MAG: NAD-dependent epimerase/dehydratase family protein [Actinobacteria bacterium]|nr:NAD-dependent epimerase/dehydratase family protein [Actinomycetota bacterium]
MKKKVIVTGGAGFIGHHLVSRLNNLGYQILILDNLSTGFEKNIPLSENIFFQNLDIRSCLSSVFSDFKPEIVFHLAARPSVPFSVANPILSNDINIYGTLNLLDVSLKNNVKRFIFSSSSSVYGGTSGNPSSEIDSPNPQSPYALQKLVGEEYCKLFVKYGLDTCSLRYFNVFGKDQDPNSAYAAVIASFLKHKKENSIPTIYGDGEQKRDFCYVDNVVLANLAAATRTAPINGESFNIGCGTNISINNVAKYFDFKKINYLDERPGDVKVSLSDISKAQALLGYFPKVDFESGIKDLI